MEDGVGSDEQNPMARYTRPVSWSILPITALFPGCPNATGAKTVSLGNCRINRSAHVELSNRVSRYVAFSFRGKDGQEAKGFEPLACSIDAAAGALDS